MISHTFIGVRDFGRSFTFYSRLLPLLGWCLKFAEEERPWAGWQPEGEDRPLFLIGSPYDGKPAEAGNGNMVALLAQTRDQVDAFYAAAMDAGATSEGQPGLRPEYHPDYYGAYIRDPDGNKICVCSHGPV